MPGDAEGEVLAGLDLPAVRRRGVAASRQPRRASTRRLLQRPGAACSPSSRWVPTRTGTRPPEMLEPAGRTGCARSAHRPGGDVVMTCTDCGSCCVAGAAAVLESPCYPSLRHERASIPSDPPISSAAATGPRCGVPCRGCGGASRTRRAATSTSRSSTPRPTRRRSCSRPRPRRASPLGTRLLLVLNGHKWKVKQRQAIVAYLQDPMPDTCLAIEGETFAKDDALAKAVAKTGEVLRYDLPKKYELAEVGRGAGPGSRAAHAAGRRQAPAGRVAATRPSAWSARSRSWRRTAAAAEADVEDVDAVCSPASEVRIFDLMDAVGARDRRRAFALLESVYAGRRGRQRGALSASSGTSGCWTEAAQLDHDDQASAARQLKVHPFTAQEAAGAAAALRPPPASHGAYRALAEAEVGMRGRAPASLESQRRREPRRPARRWSWRWRACWADGGRRRARTNDSDAGGSPRRRPARVVSDVVTPVR